MSTENSNEQSGRYSTDGRAHRYQVGKVPTPEKVDAPRPDGFQIGGASRHRATPTGVEDISKTGYHQVSGPSLAGEPLDSAVDLQGHPVSREALTPDSIIKLPGNLGDATVKSLVDLGFLRKDSDGRYSWVPANEEQKTQQANPENAADAPAHVELDVEHEALFQHGVERLGSAAVVSLAQAAIRGSDDAILKASADEYARRLGYSNPEDFRADFAAVRDGLIAKGEAMLTGTGVKDTDAFRAWARYDSENRGRFDEALLSFVDNDARPLQRLAKRYLAEQGK